MFEIKNRIMRITKGDSAAINVDLKNADGTSYEMQTGDSLTFTARRRPDKSVLMSQTSTSKIIDLIPAKTKLLEVGECCYDIELKTSAGDVFTVVGVTDKPNLIVYPEITE